MRDIQIIFGTVYPYPNVRRCVILHGYGRMLILRAMGDGGGICYGGGKGGGGILGKFRYSQTRGALSTQLRGKLVIESVLRNPEEAVLTIEH